MYFKFQREQKEDQYQSWPKHFTLGEATSLQLSFKTMFPCIPLGISLLVIRDKLNLCSLISLFHTQRTYLLQHLSYCLTCKNPKSLTISPFYNIFLCRCTTQRSQSQQAPSHKPMGFNTHTRLIRAQSQQMIHFMDRKGIN